jgi:glycosyltransferase involved in cell wall biosynthesis
MKSKTFLFVTYENPLSKDNGDRIYTCNFLETFIDLKCNVEILCYDSNELSNKSGKSLEGYESLDIEYVDFKPASKFKVMCSLLPGMIVNRKSEGFLKALECKLANNVYDFIFVNHQKMLFVLPTLLKTRIRYSLVFISHNVEYLLSLNNAKNSKSILDKIIYGQDAIKTKIYEKWLNHFDFITSISEHDQDYFNINFKHPKVSVLRPVFTINSFDTYRDHNKLINEIVIVGSFTWGPKTENLLAFLNSKNFKKLKENDINVTIVGKADVDLVRKVNSQYKGVKMTGPVRSVDEYYAKSKIAIVPELLGGGFKLKIAEAALQRTAIFAVKGSILKCNLEKDKHFIEAFNFDELIEKVIIYQNRENEIDGLIERTVVIAERDFSKEKFQLDMLKIVSNET